jgi:hypothetical protein
MHFRICANEMKTSTLSAPAPWTSGLSAPRVARRFLRRTDAPMAPLWTSLAHGSLRLTPQLVHRAYGAFAVWSRALHGATHRATPRSVPRTPAAGSSWLGGALRCPCLVRDVIEVLALPKKPSCTSPPCLSRRRPSVKSCRAFRRSRLESQPADPSSPFPRLPSMTPTHRLAARSRRHRTPPAPADGPGPARRRRPTRPPLTRPPPCGPWARSGEARNAPLRPSQSTPAADFAAAGEVQDTKDHIVVIAFFLGSFLKNFRDPVVKVTFRVTAVPSKNH